MSKYEVNNLIKNLSQSITSRNSIKKFKVWRIAAVIAMLTIAITVGVLEHKVDENSKNNVLTLNNIVKVFKKQNIYLKEGKLKLFQKREEILRETNKYSNSYSFEEVPYNAKNALIILRLLKDQRRFYKYF